jgi:hypothetical protein
VRIHQQAAEERGLNVKRKAENGERKTENGEFRGERGIGYNQETMAQIIGALASSHTPTIGFAFDRDKRDDPAWAPIFEHFEPLRQWLADKKPDVLVIIFNDHVTSFFFDHYSAFTLGIGEQFPVADEGGGARALAPAIGHPALARHIGQALMADEFDMSFFQDKPLDHGLFSPLSMLARRNDDGSWPARIIPLLVGVLQFPIPSARRCYKLGQSLRRAIESYPEDLKVALVATGGLQQHALGHAVSRSDRKRSRTPLRADTRRVRRVRGLRRFRSDYVAGDARRHVGEHPQGAPELLSALDDRNRYRDLRERGVDRRRQQHR